MTARLVVWNALPTLRDRSGDVNLRLFYRVDEFYVMRVEAYSSVRIGPWGTVFQVSFYNATHMAELASYLVMPSCQKLDLHKMIPFSA